MERYFWILNYMPSQVNWSQAFVVFERGLLNSKYSDSYSCWLEIDLERVYDPKDRIAILVTKMQGEVNFERRNSNDNRWMRSKESSRDIEKDDQEDQYRTLKGELLFIDIQELHQL